MAIRSVLKMGNPKLLETSSPIEEFDTAYLHGLIKDMRDTMSDLNGAGLAAPQIGEMHRVVIFGIPPNDRYPDIEVVPETVLINPRLEILSDSVDGMWEGCLSVPGMRGYVERPNHICYSGVDQYNKPIEREVRDFHATVVQHECDHLDGILYPMRIEDMRQFGFESELSKAL